MDEEIDPVLEINKQLKRSLAIMQAKLEETKRKTSNQGVSVIKKQSPKKINEPLAIYLEYDKLMAQNSVQEQEILSLKAQLSASKISLQEIEEQNLNLMEQNNISDKKIRNFTRQFEENAEQMKMIINQRNIALNLVKKLNSYLDSTEVYISNHLKENSKKLEVTTKMPELKSLVNDEPPLILPAEVLTKDISQKCQTIFNNRSIPFNEKIKLAFDCINHEYNALAEQNINLKNQIDVLENKLTEQENSTNFYSSAMSSMICQWKDLENSEKMKINYEGQPDEKFIEFINQNGGFTCSGNYDISLFIQQSELKDVFQSCWLSNERLKKQLKSAQATAAAVEDIERIIQNFGAKSFTQIPSIFSKQSDKISELKSERKELMEALKEKEEDLEKGRRLITNLKNEIEVLNENIQRKDQKGEEYRAQNKAEKDEIKAQHSVIIEEITSAHKDEVKDLNAQLIEAKKEIERLNKVILKISSELENQKQRILRETDEEKEDLELQLNELKACYQKLSLKTLELEKEGKRNAKEERRKARIEIERLSAVNEEQRATFDAAVLQMKKKTEDDRMLTEKLSRALEASEKRNRELSDKITELEIELQNYV